MSTAQPITAIFGQEPMREGEYPQAYIVGQPAMLGEFVVSRIAYREKNYGDHGLGWFDVFADIDSDERWLASLSARAVAEVRYAL